MASVTDNYAALANGLDPTEAFIVHFMGRPIGYVQRYLIEDDRAWRDAIRRAIGDGGGVGIDYLIGQKDLVGRGVGRRMIAQFAEACWDRYPSADQITVVLQQANVASWKALEAAEFRRVWSGHIESSDPSDAGPSFIYIARRPTD
jgi:aminoglycoside 6'-N-acetyltransferase